MSKPVIVVQATFMQSHKCEAAQARPDCSASMRSNPWVIQGHPGPAPSIAAGFGHDVDVCLRAEVKTCICVALVVGRRGSSEFLIVWSS